MNAPSLRSLIFPREYLRLKLRYLLDFLQYAFSTTFQSARQRVGFLAKMASPVDSKMSSDINIIVDSPPKRQMMHLKTKEECRLGNETIQVWTVELPSKHAEGILKCVEDDVSLYFFC